MPIQHLHMLSLLIWKSSTKCVSYSGILRDKTMDDKLIYIPNDDKQEYPICKLKLLFWKVSIKTSNKNT